MSDWKKIGKVINAEGTTITYSNGGIFYIESRLRHIPHANGEGTWDCRSFAVIHPNGTETQKWTMRGAKELVEKLEAELYHLGPDERISTI